MDVGIICSLIIWIWILNQSTWTKNKTNLCQVNVDLGLEWINSNLWSRTSQLGLVLESGGLKNETRKKKQLEGNLERGKIMSTRIETRASGRRRFDCRGREKKKSGENRTWKKRWSTTKRTTKLHLIQSQDGSGFLYSFYSRRRRHLVTDWVQLGMRPAVFFLSLIKKQQGRVRGDINGVEGHPSRFHSFGPRSQR